MTRTTICGLAIVVLALVCAADAASERRKTILVLGSGLVGTELARQLNLQPERFEVILVRSRTHVDLRAASALDAFVRNRTIDFVFFCAFDVGGSKLLESRDTNVQAALLESNTRLYVEVFGWLRRAQVPFVFFSSYRAAERSVYGLLKALGEQWVEMLPNGRVVRLWNTYGPERVSERSHVLVDWVHQCVQDGQVSARSDGHEQRQFLHVHDAVLLFMHAMERFDRAPLVVDVASGVWVSLREVGAELVAVSARHGFPCTINWATARAGSDLRNGPELGTAVHEGWAQAVTLNEGLDGLFVEYLRERSEQEAELAAAAVTVEL